MTNYKLYYMPECPFCKKVESVIKKYNVDIPLANIHEDENRSELEEKGGMVQVPALLIDDKVLYESSDIVKYIKEHLI